MFYVALLTTVVITVSLCIHFTTMVRAYVSKYVISAYNAMRSSSMLQNISRSLFQPRANPNLPFVPSTERISDNVFRILAQNPGYHTLQGTNTYLVTGKSGTEHILIDTGESVTANKYLPVLFDQVFREAKTSRLSAILLTHGHADHIGGLHAIMSELKARNMLPLPKIYKRLTDYEKLQNDEFDICNIHHDELFEIDHQTHIRAIYTPGHTTDHVSFILEEDHALLSGDCVLGCGTAVFDDLYDYMKSLERLRHLIIKRQGTPKEITTIYPGHGPVLRNEALQKIEEYIKHRNSRELQILKELQSLPPGTWETSMALVGKVYGALPLGVIVSAQANLLHHLCKLKKEGKAAFKEPDLWSLSSNR
jgi:glyoxylase-like metal-dependent hydrolase (beta-lactamase superfamily II)